MFINIEVLECIISFHLFAVWDFSKCEHIFNDDISIDILCFMVTMNFTFNICEERDLANSPPNREVNGVRISSASSSSSSSPPPSPIVAELLLFARRAFLSLRAAYLDRPLGYWSSPRIDVSKLSLSSENFRHVTWDPSWCGFIWCWLLLLRSESSTCPRLGKVTTHLQGKQLVNKF